MRGIYNIIKINLGLLLFLLLSSSVFSQQYRYIRIQKSGTNINNHINLAEIEVVDIDGVTNRSLAGTATLSSTYPSGDASKGNDGNTNGAWNYENPSAGSILHSGGSGTNEWWEIDLGALYSLSHINIYNRTDCCSNRLSSMYVLASDTPFNQSGADATNLTAALTNADFTYQFGAVTTSTMQVVTISPYCTPININSYNNYYISDVSLGTLSNATAGTTGTFNNYSATFTPVDVTAGGSLNGTISVDIDDYNNNPNDLNVWIDLNQDLDFDDPDERYLVSVSDPTNPGTGIKTVTVPVSIPIPTVSTSVLVGNTRMRIGFIHYKNNKPYTYCDFNFKAGEVEDYTINIVDACSTNTWTGTVSSDWNDADNWTCGNVPIITTNVLIPSSVSNYPEIAAVDAGGLANNIEIENGATVTVFSNSLEIAGTLLLNGFIYLEGEGQLIQNNGSVLDPTSTGRIEIDQQGVASTYAYNYWGSPVGTALISGTNSYSYKLKDILYDGANPVKFVSGYNGALGTPISIANYWIYKYANKSGAYSQWQAVGSTGDLNAGQGFSMKGPNPSTSTSISNTQNYTFKGLPNNGTIELAVNAGNEYLVGNPYPSAIEIAQFIIDNPILEGGVINFWEQFDVTNHNLANYEGAYWITTGGGGVQTAIPSGVNQTPTSVSKKTPTQNIPVAQGFFVKADSSAPLGSTIQFNNNQRVFVKESSGDAVFMKLDNVKSKTASTSIKDKDTRTKIRLGFDAPKLDHRQLLLAIDERATDAVDWGFDGEMTDVLADDMYWDLADKKYIIQATNSISSDKEIPLGITTKTGGLASIKIDALENVDESVELYIKDALLGTTTKINNVPLEIELEAGEYKDRFSLVFKPNKTLDIKDEILENGLYVYVNNNAEELGIRNTTNSELLEVKLYNSLGQEFNTWTKNLEDTLVVLPVNNIATGVYIVQIKTATGTITKKVIIE